MNRCIGCGILLQTEKKEELGYIPNEKLGKNVYCERCYRLIHYRDYKSVCVSSFQVLEKINKEKGFVFFFVDFFNLNEEVWDIYRKIQLPKVVVVNKMDLLPKSFHIEKIKNWIKKEYSIEEDFLFTSALKHKNIGSFLHLLEKRKIKKGFLLGLTNVGKSTFVNSVRKKEVVTTSLLPNTTLDFISIPLENGYSFIDTPGFSYDSPIYSGVPSSFLKKLNFKTVLKPRTFQLKKDVFLLFEEFFVIQNMCEKCNLTFYISHLFPIIKKYKIPSFVSNFEKVKLSLKKDQDLVIKGVGFITIKSDVELFIFIKNKNWMEVRNSLFKEEV